MYGKIDLLRLEISKSKPDIELILMTSNTRTIHVFLMKN